MVSIPERSDAVVIGAGPAGAVVARRLADDGRRVVLVEAGPGGPRPPSVAGLDLIAASGETSRHWPGLTVRDRPGSPLRPYRQGRGLGGGSMINGMLLSPGDRADYERWAGERACTGWGPDDLAPWLDRAAAAAPTQRVAPGPVSEALARAAADDGLPVGGSSLDADRLGVLAAELSAAEDRRVTSIDANLGDDRPEVGGVRDLLDGSLTVASGRPVRRLVDAGPGRHRVVLDTGEVIESGQVVLCAGALGGPALLLRSGLTDRPVGQTLVDHPSYAFTLVLRPGGALGERLAASSPVVSTLVRWSSGPAWPGDLQAIAIDRVSPPGYQGPPLAVVAVGLMAVTARGSLRPTSAAGATATSPAGLTPPGLDIETGALGTDDDRQRLRDGVRRVWRWLSSPAFDDVIEEVHLDEAGRPAAGLDDLSDAELDLVIASSPGPYAHPAGACPLGPEEVAGSVTSIERGRLGQVLDRPGLRLADASIFPDLVRGGLQLPVSAVAARIADDIVAGG